MATTFKFPVTLLNSVSVPSNAATGVLNYFQNTGLTGVKLAQPAVTPDAFGTLLAKLAPQPGGNLLETLPSTKITLTPALGISVVDKQENTPIDHLLLGAGTITGLRTGGFTNFDFQAAFPAGTPGNLSGNVLTGAFRDALLSTDKTSTFNLALSAPVSQEIAQLLGLPPAGPLDAITLIP